MNALSITSLTLTSGGGETLVLPWSSLATADVRAHARVESNAWIKRLRLVPYGDVPMRDAERVALDELDSLLAQRQG